MRALWERFKRFPSMPPFGEAWFRTLDEETSLLGSLRLEWIYLNIVEDRRLEDERRKDEIEYFGLFADREMYAHIKGIKTGSEQPGFSVERSDEIYNRRVDAAARGEPDIVPRRESMGARVKEMRRQMVAGGGELPWERLRREHGVSDPWTAPTDDDEDPGTLPDDGLDDTLIIER